MEKFISIPQSSLVYGHHLVTLALSADRMRARGSLFVASAARLVGDYLKGAISVELSRILVIRGNYCQPSSHKDGVISSYETGGSALLGADL